MLTGDSRLDLLQLACTAALTGLIWVVQVVVYPAFRFVGAATAPQSHAAHRGNTPAGVVPLMLREVGLAALCAAPQASGTAIVLAGLVGVIWASTFFVQVPLHERLTHGANGLVVEKLIATNWIRTVAWTVRVGLLVLAN